MADDQGDLAEQVHRCSAAAADSGFTGVIRVDLDGELVHESAHGQADRARHVANTVDTRIGIASGAKGFTALVVMALVERDVVTLDTSARSLLGNDLPMIDSSVTIRHLLSHRSGIGDYLDENALPDVTDYVMPVPVHQLCDPEHYLPILDGHAMNATPGDRFEYNNGGFAVLALLAERATRRSFYDLVDELVCRPAGLGRTGFLRSDELPGDAAIGYLHPDGLRTNVLHLPVRGSGDGGIYTTAGNIDLLWQAVFGGRIVRPDSLAQMIHPWSTAQDGSRYGLGFWLHPTHDSVILTGYDAGASFRSLHQPSRNLTWSVLSNSSEGAWPVARALADLLDGN